MGAPDYVRNMYAYTAWADGLVLDAVGGLSEEQLRSEAGRSRGSVLDNLLHVVGAQIHWLEMWRGEGRGQRPKPPAGGAMAWLRERFGRSHRELEAFVGTLDDSDIEREAEVNASGLRRTRWPLWQMMVHVVLHSTQHRAETAVALTALGSSPGDLDYGHFCDMRQSASAGTLEMMRALYGYNEWGDNKILAALSGMSDEELLKPRGLSHGSLGLDLAHALLAQVGWLRIWQKYAPPTELPGAGTGRHLDNLADGYRRSHAAIRAFIESASGDDLGQEGVIEPDQYNGWQRLTRPLWDMMFHVVNHSMQHRAEAAMALTGMGRSVGDVDLLDYLDEPA